MMGVIQGASIWYLFLTGLNKSFDFKRLGMAKRIVIMILTPVCLKYLDGCETIALIWALITPKTDFKIVKKYI